MSQLRIRTARHTTRVAAPPQRVFQLVANAEHWPRIFDTIIAVEHIGWDAAGERVRFWGTFGDRHGSWVSARELNPKRMQLRFRQEQAPRPFATLGGLWAVVPKRDGAVVLLDHYYTVVDDDPAAARHLHDIIEHSGIGMLDALRQAAEDQMWLPVPSGRTEGVTSR
ncbi:MAG TPA: SRPBCC family protein [Actinophytocola sp.]|jgi:aromatase|uniref:SRPBCC family protein n=1 Tax=Actinophytocola sp. TaxID=1872138 RepID=UPI002F9237B6